MASFPLVKSLIPPSVFGGVLYERSYVALSFIFIEQFLAVFSPVLTRFLSFFQALLFPGSGGSGDYTFDNVDSSEFASIDVIPESGEKNIPVVSKTYARFIDDKKPTVGTRNDIKKLEDFGFDKYRYLSKSFMKRNNIVKEKD